MSGSDTHISDSFFRSKSSTPKIDLINLDGYTKGKTNYWNSCFIIFKNLTEGEGTTPFVKMDYEI